MLASVQNTASDNGNLPNKEPKGLRNNNPCNREKKWSEKN